MKEKLAKKAVAYADERYGITLPWDFIIGLVDWFMSECGNTEKQFTQTAKRPTWFQRRALRNTAYHRLRKLGYSRSKARRGSWAAVDAIITTASSTNLTKAYKAFCH